MNERNIPRGQVILISLLLELKQTSTPRDPVPHRQGGVYRLPLADGLLRPVRKPSKASRPALPIAKFVRNLSGPLHFSLHVMTSAKSAWRKTGSLMSDNIEIASGESRHETMRHEL